MRLPGQPDSRLALAWLLCLFVVLLLLMAAPRGHGQTESSSAPPTLSASLSEAEQTLAMLLTRLGERRQQVSDLQENLRLADEKLSALAASYASLQQTLEAARLSLETSQADLTETSSLLSALSTRYDALERQWLAYRSEMVTQIVTLERQARNARRWAAVFGVGTAVGFLVSVVLALR